MTTSGNRTEVHFVTNADLRASRQPVALDDPDGVADMPPRKRAALLSNPQLGPDKEAVRILGTLDGRIVGRLDLLAGSIETPEGAIPCFWGSSLFVTPAARGHGMGSTLIRASHELREVAAVCAPSRLSYPLYMSLGYLDVPMPRYVLVRRTGPLVQHWLGKGPAARLAAAVADTGTAAHHGLLGISRSVVARGLEAEAVETFPIELEPHLQERRAPLAMHRSAAWLDWIVRESFGDGDDHRRALYLVRDRHGEVVAYFLIKARRYSGVTEWGFENLDLGSLIDWAIFEPKRVGLQQLVFLALGELTRWRVDAMEVCVPPDAGALRLGRFGFRRVREQHIVVRASAGGVLARPESQQIERWSVRPAEGDHAFS